MVTCAATIKDYVLYKDEELLYIEDEIIKWEVLDIPEAQKIPTSLKYYYMMTNSPRIRS